MVATEKEQKPKTEYTAQAVSSFVNGEVKLKVGENAFTASGLFDLAEIPYARVNALGYADYTVNVKTDDGDYAFSRMGSWAQGFYDALCEAYNKAVLRAFFVSGNPILKASGDYRLAENGTVANDKAPASVYENCVVALPPNGNARRIPLCFVNGIDKGNFEFTLKLNMGESYTFSKLGYETARFAEIAEKQIRALHEKTVSAVKEIDPSLTPQQASQIAKLVPEGAAAPMGQFAAIAPSFKAAVKNKISQTRASDSYKAFAELCDPDQIWIGFKKNDIRSEGGEMIPVLPEEADPPEGAEGADAEPDPYLFWMIAPSPNKQYAAVEFAVRPGESAATFVYRMGDDFSRSAAHLNRALEAISFKREVIRLTDEELLKPENVDYYMAAKRTASLQYVRKNFAGRVIHSSPESWKRKLLEMWNTPVTK